LVCFLIMCTGSCLSVRGESQLLDETAVKAGFLLNFAKFVEWPAAKSGSLNFCIVGDDRMAVSLEAGLARKSIGSRSLVVRNRPGMAELLSCAVIYIGRTEKKMAAQIAQSVAGQHILTVSEFPELGSQGVAINFFLDEERVRFEVHLGAVKQAGLTMSSRLLSLARVVGN